MYRPKYQFFPFQRHDACWMDWWMDGQTDGRMDGQTYKNISITSFSVIFVNFESINYSYVEKNQRGNVYKLFSCNIPNALKSGNLPKLGKIGQKSGFDKQYKKMTSFNFSLTLRQFYSFISKIIHNHR